MIKDSDKLSEAEQVQLSDHGFWLPEASSAPNTGSAPAARAKAKPESPSKQKFALEIKSAGKGYPARLELTM